MGNLRCARADMSIDSVILNGHDHVHQKVKFECTILWWFTKDFQEFPEIELAVSDLTVIIWLLRSWVVFLSPVHNSYKFCFKLVLFVIRWCFDWTENILPPLRR